MQEPFTYLLSVGLVLEKLIGNNDILILFFEMLDIRTFFCFKLKQS